MELKTGYSSYDHDRLDPADSMRIERKLYFEQDKADISGLTALSMEQLREMREESAAAEQAVYEDLKQRAAAWEAQAGQTLTIDKAIEYVRTPTVQHTSNQWEAADNDRHIISNSVYQMRYHSYEHTRYDREKGQSVPYAWTLSWSVYTNSPDGYGQAKIAGQEKKFADKAAMEKYLNGRIKAYQHLFTEISPPVPKEYADHFKVNGQLLPGYTVEGEERAQPPTEKAAPAEPPQDTGQRKEQTAINEQFSVLIDSRTRFETGTPGGVWLSMPTTTEQLHEAMRSVGITADNPQDFFINGFADTEQQPFDVPLPVIQSASLDELNYLGNLLSMQSDGDRDKFAAAVTLGEYAGNIKDLINLAQNLDCYWIYPTVQNEADYGNYLIDELDELELPEEVKKYFMYEEYGRDAAINDGGRFTEQGYIYNNKNTFTEWYSGRENDIPKEYKVMSFPQPEHTEPEQSYMDVAAPGQEVRAAEKPTEPRPVIPIVLTSEKPAEKLKEITDRLEQGITELFDSERYKEYLRVMSKFHNYSFNNTLLIAMQKPDASLVAGFSAWKNNFERNVMKGQKGIKIIAPSPFKIRQEVEKIDPHTQKPVIGKDGKPVTEEKEIKIPAYKVVTVFDVSQTEGKELPDIAVDELTGDVESYKDFFAALEKTSPVPIAFEQIAGTSHGYYHLADKRIAIQEGMSELQTLKTAIHEIAHAKLHDIDLNAPKDEQPRADRSTREVEAESVAYTVCQHYGLDTSDYSFGYVAGWSSGRELAELKSSLETIRTAAAEIINSIDEHIAEIQKAQDKEQTAEQPTTAEQTDAPAQETAQTDAPDPTIGISDMENYGYSWDGMLPLKQETAEHLFHEDLTIFRIYADGSEGMVTDLDDLREHAEKGGLFGIEKADWEAYREYRDMKQDLQENEASKEARLLYGKEDAFGIYQLKRGDETRDFRFEPYDRLQAAGNVVDKANYELVHSAPLTPGTSLEDIYTRFNIDHPKDFKGHSLSVSDVVVLHQNGQDTAHYVDSFGYKDVPEFLQPENHLKATEQTTEQNENMIDGIINNEPPAPTVEELEAKVKAGETISLVDLANAVKADKENGKETKPKRKPSIRAQLKADKERAQKKNAKQKSQDLERS